MDKTMPDKLMYLTDYDTQNYLIYRLQLVAETLGHSTK